MILTTFRIFVFNFEYCSIYSNMQVMRERDVYIYIGSNLTAR